MIVEKSPVKQAYINVTCKPNKICQMEKEKKMEKENVDFCCDCICLSCKKREYYISHNFDCNRCDSNSCKETVQECEEYQYSEY